MPPPLNRRAFFRVSWTGLLATFLAACGLRQEPQAAAPPARSPSAPVATEPHAATPAQSTGPTSLPPTPACADDEPTPPQAAGPFYTPASPQRTSFVEPGTAGTDLLLTGQVLDTACRPVAGALLDFWQADDASAYDNQGFRFRGHQFADDQGRYLLETVLPGLYTGRTRHIHVRVQAPNQPILTTQLYFPDEPANRTDRLFDPALLVDLTDTGEGLQARFNFVLDLG